MWSYPCNGRPAASRSYSFVSPIPSPKAFVESLARPNGNLTGFSNPELPLMGKWLQILKDIAPSVTRVGLMISTFNAASAYHYRSFDAAVPNPRFGLPGCYLLSFVNDSRLANLLKFSWF